MSGLALFLLGGFIAPLLILALAMASTGMELDLHVTLRGPAAQLPATLTPTSPVPTARPRHDMPRGTALAYADADIRVEAALRHLCATLDRIVAQAGPQAALIAANTARRIARGDTPKRQMVDFARDRLELIALGTDRIAASHARSALGIA